MEKRFPLIFGLLLVFALFIATILTPKVTAVPSLPTFQFNGGSLSANLGSWEATGAVYPVAFDVTQPGGIDIIFYDVDGSLLAVDNETVWNIRQQGTALLGVTAGSSITAVDPPNNSVYLYMLNQNRASGSDWSGKPITTLGPDGESFTSDDTRSWLFQSWYRPDAGGKTGQPSYGDPAYNNESYATPNPRYDTAPSHGASHFNSFDLRIRITHNGDDSYTAERWVRMHNSAATVEGATWIENKAKNNTDAEEAWRKFENGAGVYTFPMSGLDLTAVKPFVGLGNWVPRADNALNWGDIEVTGTPVKQSTVWVNSAWTGSSPGDTVDGKIFGWNAFAAITDAISAVEEGGTVYVAAGTYNVSSSVEINKAVTVRGPDSGTAVVRSTTAQNPVFKVTGSSVVIRNLEITTTVTPFGLVGNETTSSLVLINDRAGVSDVLIENNTIHAPETGAMSTWTSRGIYVGRGNSVTIAGNTIYNTRNGIIGTYDSTLVITNNLIYNTKGGIMNYTSNLTQAADRTMSGNRWGAHNEWDIVWNSGGTYDNPLPAGFYQNVLALSAANNGAYVVDRRGPGTAQPAGGNRSHIFVDANHPNSKEVAHPAQGNFNEPFATLALGLEAVVEGGTVYATYGDSGVFIEIISDEASGVIDVTRYSQSNKNKPSGMTPAGIFLDIDRSPNLAGSAVRIEVEYDRNQLPRGVKEDELKLYRYNPKTQKWNLLSPQGVDKARQIVWAELNDFSTFGLFAKAPGGSTSDTRLPETAGTLLYAGAGLAILIGGLAAVGRSRARKEK